MKKQKKSPANADQKAKQEKLKSVDFNNASRFQTQFITSWSYKGTTPEGKSETVPDLNLTVRQLLVNHSRGTNGHVDTKEPIFFDLEIPTIRDITDVKLYKERLSETLSQVNEFIKNDKQEAKEKREADKKAKEDAEAEKITNAVRSAKKAESESEQ